MVCGGKALSVGGKGIANVAEKIAPDTNTIFEIGSLTRTFTASLIFQLQEEEGCASTLR